MHRDILNHIFRVKLDSWTPDRSVLSTFFSPGEVSSLYERSSAFDHDSRTVCFLTFETRFSALGGLGTVSRYMPRALAQAGERSAIKLYGRHQDYAQVVLNGINALDDFDWGESAAKYVAVFSALARWV